MVRSSMKVLLFCLAMVLADPGAGTMAWARNDIPASCTILGSPGEDTLVGTAGDDVICGFGGDDRLFGGGGDDILAGGAGRDVLRGSSGDDLLVGGSERDRLGGGRGRDLLRGESGRDRLTGGPGADQLVGGLDGDILVAAGQADACDPDAFDRVEGSCIEDIAPPSIEEVVVAGEIGAGQTLNVSWRVRDASGIYSLGESPGTWLRIGGASGWIDWCDFTLAGERVEGDAFDARYEASCAVPQDAVNGRYSVFLGAADAFGNGAFTDGAESFVVFGGAADAAAPEVEGAAFSEATVAPGGTVTLRWRATDETGVAYVLPWCFGPNGFLVDDAGRLWTDIPQPTLVEGDALDGAYEATLAVQAAAIPGTYTLWFSRGDVLGNRVFAPASDDPGAPVSFEIAP